MIPTLSPSLACSGPSPENRCYVASPSTGTYPTGFPFCAANSLLPAIAQSVAEIGYVYSTFGNVWIGGRNIGGTWTWEATGVSFSSTGLVTSGEEATVGACLRTYNQGSLLHAPLLFFAFDVNLAMNSYQ
jgi:hypothetical protein